MAYTQSNSIAEEINILSKLEHPHIIRLLDYNLDCEYVTRDGKSVATVMMVLQLAKGELFDSLLSGPMSEALACAYFKQIMSAVQYLHKHNVIHRDIKPQNLLLDHEYRIKLCDFGLSKMLKDPNEKLTTVVGTKGFRAT
eukprot:UN00816